MLHILRHFQRKGIVPAVLVTLHIGMPHDVIVDQKLPAIHLSVDEGTVLFVREEDGTAGLPVDDLLHEVDHQRIKAFVDIGEDRIQGKVRQEHIVRVAEHDIVRSCQVEQASTGPRQAGMFELNIPD